MKNSRGFTEIISYNFRQILTKYITPNIMKNQVMGGVI